MTTTTVTIPHYRDTYHGHPRRAQIQAALAGWLHRPVTVHTGEDTTPHPLILTVTGADPADVAEAAEFYLGSAGIAFHLEAA